MKIDYEFRSLDRWPGDRTTSRKVSPFRASYNDTLKLLQLELNHLRAANVVIQADCDSSQIRNDGMLRSGAKLRGPGVILSFDSKHGPLSYPCDKFANWDCNLRAIALSLEALRKVDRYGVTKRAEQYKGWGRLPPNPSSDSVSVITATFTLLGAAKLTSNKIEKSEYDAVYRAAVLNTHPDHGGDAEAFKQVQEAKEVLDRHFVGGNK